MGYALTEAIKNNSSRGKGLAQKFKTDITSILKSQETLELEDIKRLYQFLNKAEKQYEPKKRLECGALTKGTLEFLANGGTSGLAFCRNVLRQEGILKSYQKEISEDDMNKEDTLAKIEVQVAKALNEEKRLATFLVLEPQDADYTTSDLHADWYDEDIVEQSCHNFNRYCRKANLLHLMPTTAYEFVESYITKADCVLGNKFIKKGSWLATIYVDESSLGEEIWLGIKNGTFNGLSIQCTAQVEDIE